MTNETKSFSLLSLMLSSAKVSLVKRTSILVLGATSYIGTQLLQELAQVKEESKEVKVIAGCYQRSKK
jgi:hypothetical protein